MISFFFFKIFKLEKKKKKDMSSRKDRQAQIIDSQNQYIQELRERNGQLVWLRFSLPLSLLTRSHAALFLRPR